MNRKKLTDQYTGYIAHKTSVHHTHSQNKISQKSGTALFRTILLGAAGVACALALTGCSFGDVTASLGDFFRKEVMAEEETAQVSTENRMITAQVFNGDGEAMTDADGEPLTVMAMYETASGGEDRINEQGIPETHAVGEVMTYRQGEPVLQADGTPETYAGGEEILGLFGNTVKDGDGNPVTRAEGEVVTHGDSDIVYDEEGNKMTYNGEPLTYAPGEYMYDTDGEQRFFGVSVLKDENGEPLTNEDGQTLVSPIEVIMDENGDPVLDENGEAATKVLEPKLPDRVIDQPVIEGCYYIRNLLSEYVYFSAPEVYASNINVPEGAETDTSEVQEEQEPSASIEEDEHTPVNTAEPGDELTAAEEQPAQETEQPADDAAELPAEDTAELPAEEAGEQPDAAEAESELVQNLQLEVLGRNLPYFELRFDPEGYGYFVLEGTEMVLGYEGTLRNGANVLLQEMEKIPYPQYAYWDDPVYYLEDHQKWIIKKAEDGVYTICSAANTDYVMTVDDLNGIHYANIMMWKNEGRDQQKFAIEADVPKVENTLEEDTYYIRSGLSSWMMVSIGDYNYDDERNIYLYPADGQDGQKFTVTYDEYGLATIAHNESTKVLTVQDGAAVNNQNIFQYESDGEDWQKWILEPNDDGGYIIRSARNVSEVINLMGGVTMDLQPIRCYWEDQTYAQCWYFMTEVPLGGYAYESMEAYAQNFSSNTGYLILVNNTTNHVGVYTGYEGNWTCIHYWDCVTGKSTTPTVKGEYTINGRLPSFDGDTDSPEWYTCYYATMFYPQYFFHSIIYYKGTEDIMDATMGWNASHGCVRLYIENAQWIYENIPDGTKVVSY